MEPENTDPTEIRESTETADATSATEQNLVIEELLVEEISIDGMCGVY